MKAEIVANIILTAFLVFVHILVWIIFGIWRLNNYHKGGLHYSGTSLFALLLSTFFNAFLAIGCFTFFNQGISTTKGLVCSILLFWPMLLIGLKDGCFCIYIDGDYAIKKTLFSNVRINLKESGTVIDDTLPRNKWRWITITSSNNDVISFNSIIIEGNINLFVSTCIKINSGN